ALMTSFYSWRLFFLTFYGEPRWDVPGHSPGVIGGEPDLEHGHDHEPHESPPVMLVPLALLAVGSVVAGFAFAPYFIGGGYAEFWGRSLAAAPGNEILEAMHHVPLLVAWSATIAMLIGFGLA